jgi:hypothetical protein
MTDFDTIDAPDAEPRTGYRLDPRTRASDSIEEAPLLALVGGLAAGALIAALLPRTETETRAFRPVGNRVKGSAKAAVRAAKNAGTSRLDELGLTRDRGSEAIRSIFQGAIDAAKTSAQAALDTSRKRD